MVHSFCSYYFRKGYIELECKSVFRKWNILICESCNEAIIRSYLIKWRIRKLLGSCWNEKGNGKEKINKKTWKKQIGIGFLKFRWWANKSSGKQRFYLFWCTLLLWLIIYSIQIQKIQKKNNKIRKQKISKRTMKSLKIY